MNNQQSNSASNSTYWVVFCTCPDKKTALQLAEQVVGGKSAACVNLMEGVTSIYRWQDKIETSTECLMILKTSSDKYPQLEASLREHHPYEVPEIIALPITQGLPAYLAWLQAAVAN